MFGFGECGMDAMIVGETARTIERSARSVRESASPWPE